MDSMQSLISETFTASTCTSSPDAPAAAAFCGTCTFAVFALDSAPSASCPAAHTSSSVAVSVISSSGAWITLAYAAKLAVVVRRNSANRWATARWRSGDASASRAAVSSLTSTESPCPSMGFMNWPAEAMAAMRRSLSSSRPSGQTMALTTAGIMTLKERIISSLSQAARHPRPRTFIKSTGSLQSLGSSLFITTRGCSSTSWDSPSMARSRDGSTSAWVIAGGLSICSSNPGITAWMACSPASSWAITALAARRTDSSGSQMACWTAGMMEDTWSRMRSREAESITACKAMQTPSRIRGLFDLMDCSKMGIISCITRPPSFSTSSPTHREATFTFSADPEARLVMIRRMRMGMISFRVRGVFCTMAFQTWAAA
mmetsp:Transcript_50557/g.110645  ORF Transcript_50557/g.110645 Transcript_50557/m.110645 type:complete len:374 (+) Transcript_50557:1173-2294(+)